MTDFLEARSMNLNVRVSPMMKMQLTEKVRKLGLNITDYIYVTIAKSESMDSDMETLNAEKFKLQQQVKQLQATVSRYDSLLEPAAQELIGHEVTNQNNQRTTLKDKFDVLQLMLSTFKTRQK